MRELQRFHTKECHDQFYAWEKRQALAHWRQMQRQARAQKIFGGPTTLDGSDDEIQIKRRA
jgi:hypothetical protein